MCIYCLYKESSSGGFLHCWRGRALSLVGWVTGGQTLAGRHTVGCCLVGGCIIPSQIWSPGWTFQLCCFCRRPVTSPPPGVSSLSLSARWKDHHWRTFPVVFKLPDCPSTCDSAPISVNIHPCVYLAEPTRTDGPLLLLRCC